MPVENATVTPVKVSAALVINKLVVEGEENTPKNKCHPFPQEGHCDVQDRK